jgi:integrase
MKSKIDQANTRLKLAKVGVQICVTGERLWLRATLPPKPTSRKVCSHQQRISLGVRNSPAGLQYAEREARKIGALLDCKEFDWTPYMKALKPKAETVRDWVNQLHADYFSRRKETHKTLTTWKGDYQRSFSKLPQDQVLTAELLKTVLKKTEPDSKTRKRLAMAFGALAKFAGIDFDPKPLAGNYSPKKVTPRDLPTDEMIAEAYHSLHNPCWQWVYGMLACYGLRPHEVFHLDYAQLRQGNEIVSVLDGKTGSRLVWPFYPEWFEQWSLTDVKVPDIQLDRSNTSIGRSCCHYFSGKLSFKLYDLRHCWAIRTLEFGLDVTLAAQQMGHSVQVHSEQYHAWITERHHQRAVDLVLKKTDRPRPPLLS